ncbi:MAG TPA: hypothetical protein VLA72_03595 [Anaerolineales bacterium]|nr:hypothetical protein [Anaerolineales bacterium]
MNSSLLFGILIILVIIILSITIKSKKKKSARESEFFPGQFDDPSDTVTSNVKFEHVDNLIKKTFQPKSALKSLKPLASTIKDINLLFTTSF